jgi:EPSP synthase (3-phosphoshikimate 1-carboxyvinyltransferase)
VDRLVIRSGNRLKGSVQIHGAKNAALPQIAVALLSTGPLEIGNVPDLIDVATMPRLIECSAPRIALPAGLASPMEPWLAPDVQRRLCPVEGDAVDGALHLARRAVMAPAC